MLLPLFLSFLRCKSTVFPKNNKKNQQLFYDVTKNTSDFFVSQLMVHRQTDNFIRNLRCDRKVLRRSTQKPSISTKRTDKRVEVSTTKHILFFHLEIELVMCLTIYLCVNEDGEIAVISHTDDTDLMISLTKT